MPRRAKGPRLYLDPRRKQWIIRDGARFVRTGCSDNDSGQAEKCLAQYITHKHKPSPSCAPLIADVLNIYGQEIAPHRRSARNLGYQIKQLLGWWGTKTVADISAKSCRDYAATKTESAAAQDLKILRAAVGYWHREYGPLTFIPSFWTPRQPAARERWLTRSEAARLLWAARRHQHLRRMILLGLYTGSRPGVILALQWDQLDLTAGVMQRVKGLQDTKKRAPPVRLGRRILTHLRRWRQTDRGVYVCHLNGERVRDPHTSWRQAVKLAKLPGVTPHTLRHTRATWLMQAGVPIWEAAGHLGMTTKTLESVYGKHSPDYQERAANI